MSQSSYRPWTTLRQTTRGCRIPQEQPLLPTFANTCAVSTTYNSTKYKINGKPLIALKVNKETQTNIIIPPDSTDILLHQEGPTKLLKFFPAIRTDEKVVYASVQLTDVVEQDLTKYDRTEQEPITKTDSDC